MMRLSPILFPILLFAGCGDAEQSGEPAETPEPAARAPAAAQIDAEPAAEKPLTSVMRPSVVAEAEPEEPPPQPPQPVRAVIPFAEGGNELSEEARSALDALIATPAAAGQSRIIIRGHSDSKGTDRQNIVASRKRAEAVRDYFLARGVPESRITVIALGETRPLAPNATPDGSDFEEGRRQNRRADVEIYPEEPKPAAPALVEGDVSDRS